MSKKKELEEQNKQKQADLVSTLRHGMTTPFWDIIKKICQDNINQSQAQLDELLDDDGKVSPADLALAKILRAKILDRRALMDLPEDIIKDCESNGGATPAALKNLDPFAR